MKDIHQRNKVLVGRLRSVLYDLEPSELEGQLAEIFDPNCKIRLAYPFEDIDGPKELYERVYRPLIDAIPDLERRDFIVVAGPSVADTNWVCCGGHYVGVFEQPWLDIPPTCHAVWMRFHEFYHVADDRIVEMQGIWDIPELMMQARAWPMAPSVGREWMAPAPATQDGLSLPPRNAEESEASLKLVWDMLHGLLRHAEGGEKAMDLPAYWHPKMTWYGPAGVGTNRRITGFRNWHQIPFLKSMPDRGIKDDINQYFFADGPYVAETAWPGMYATISDDGWMGIAPGNQEITMRSLDIWRCENGMLRENWVLVDLLDVYHQINVDVFSRMREFTVERQAVRPAL